MLNPTDEIRGRAGYKKIQKCAEISRKIWDCDFTWVDTCCIDKTSSSELSESINSMYAWYRDSYICFAYLEDFHDVNISQVSQKTRWFTRGWTLQELLAPEEVIFFSASWKRIGNKKSHLPSLESITGIDQSILKMNKLQGVSVAKKMKWVANRTTTKKEDLAYCMLGIFGVILPLLYGEGDKAFTRLQEEIMRNSEDVTLFLWISLNENAGYSRGALAHHPNEFADSTAPNTPMNVLDEPYQMTNKGLQITTPLMELDHVDPVHVSFLKEDPFRSSLFLLSFDQHDPKEGIITHHVVLRKVKDAKDHYVRAYPHFQFVAPRKAPTTWPRNRRPREQTIIIVERLSLSNIDWVLPCEGFEITEVIYNPAIKFLNPAVSELKLTHELVQTTSSADNGVIEALYSSHHARRGPGSPNPSLRHILLRYEQQHARIHMFIFYDLRAKVSEIGGTISIDSLPQAVRKQHYPSGIGGLISSSSKRLSFFYGHCESETRDGN
ncbi:Vegetative incompatibility protein HET-E-1 [Colletotrichum fructicola]|nr:Vegetative incompatibility protein HET-E-1 [Colletotrichum fructicola]KAF4909155.1 Vegetative incompatibility protein HET-E-1 [Colletotrichum fructicola]KAF4934200.1 Vegetative incompatibility protein HET-E-1 [Colletotrichum fructicola]